MTPVRRVQLGLSSAARLGAALRQARKELGWNQAELSDRSGVSRPQISAVESARADLKASTLLKLLKALDCDLAIHPIDRSGFQLDDHLDQFAKGPDDPS